MADARAAWTGTYPSPGDRLPIRVEAASLLGHVVYFEILFPWTTLNRPANGPRAAASDSNRVWFLLYLPLLGAILAVARLQWKAGRGILAVHGERVCVRPWCSSCGWCSAPTMLERPSTQVGIASAVMIGAVTAAAYLALEPWVRRLWPHMMITWARVLRGGWRDTGVGRDLLIAVVCATTSQALHRVADLAVAHLGGAPAGPTSPLRRGFGFVLDNLMGGRLMASVMIGTLYRALVLLMCWFFFLFVAKALLRKTWLATIVVLPVLVCGVRWSTIDAGECDRRRALDARAQRLASRDPAVRTLCSRRIECGLGPHRLVGGHHQLRRLVRSKLAHRRDARVACWVSLRSASRSEADRCSVSACSGG